MKKGKGMNSPVGMYSSKGNPMKPANQVASKMGPGSNPDQAKANKLLQQAHAKNESLRGKSGM
tara:strand:- start:156 stop:344 length:189 start_codon:yes stop_codon:yes gene_type:complete